MVLFSIFIVAEGIQCSTFFGVIVHISGIESGVTGTRIIEQVIGVVYPVTRNYTDKHRSSLGDNILLELDMPINGNLPLSHIFPQIHSEMSSFYEDEGFAEVSYLL